MGHLRPPPGTFIETESSLVRLLESVSWRFFCLGCIQAGSSSQRDTFAIGTRAGGHPQASRKRGFQPSAGLARYGGCCIHHSCPVGIGTKEPRVALHCGAPRGGAAWGRGWLCGACGFG